MPSNQRRSVVYSQNFLRSGRLVERLLDRSGIGADDLVVEVGPGTGVITERLAGRCRQVLAVEIDQILAEGLRRRFAGVGNVAVFAGDFLDFPLPITGYKVFANPPFNATAAVIAKLTGGSGAADEAHLVVQREAAAKLLGEPRESLAAVLLKPWFEPTVTHRFRREDFAPPPGVEVVMLRLRKRGPPLVAADEAGLYRDFVTHAFTAWQATVSDVLVGVLGTRLVRRIERRTGVDLGRPPTTVPFEEWMALFGGFLEAGTGQGRRAVAGAEARLRGQQAALIKTHRTRVSGRGR